MTRFLFWALAFLSLTAITMTGIAAADTWWHLAAGREIVNQGGLLSIDPFSFTAGEAYWFNHEWLVEIVFFLFVKFGGLNGLYALRTLMVFAAFALIPILAHKNRSVLVALWPVTVLFLGQASYFLDARAYLFTYLFLSLTIYFVRQYLNDNRKVWLWAGVLIMIPWANCHGAYLLGTVTWGIATFSQMTLRAKNWKAMLVTCLAGLLVCVINPYGYHIWLFPFSLSEHPVYKLHLNEWQRPDLLGSHAPYLLLLVLGLGILYKARAQRWEWLLSLAYLGLGFVGWRHCTLAALVLAHTASSGLPQWGQNESRTVRAFLFGLPLLLSVYLCAQRAKGGAAAWMMLESHFPTRVALILRESPELPRKVMNPYEWGGYLSWELGPEFKIFIDGRAHTLFPDQTYLDSLVMQFGGTSLRVPELEMKTREQVLADFQAQLVLVTRIQGKQYEWMRGRADWVLLFEDHNSALFVLDSPQTVDSMIGKIKTAERAILYAQRFQGRIAERKFLEKALELAQTPQLRESVQDLLRNRFPQNSVEK